MEWLWIGMSVACVLSAGMALVLPDPEPNLPDDLPQNMFEI